MEPTPNTPTNTIPETLTGQQALNILIQGVQYGQTKGIYSLSDAELISKAVRLFSQEQPVQEQPETLEPVQETV
jgi:hypothetical protein